MRKIITIGREFGAGGGEIGKRVAKEMGIEYYDKDIIFKTVLACKNLRRISGLPRACLIFIINRWRKNFGRRSWTLSANWQIRRAV